MTTTVQLSENQVPQNIHASTLKYYFKFDKLNQHFPFSYTEHYVNKPLTVILYHLFCCQSHSGDFIRIIRIELNRLSFWLSDYVIFIEWKSDFFCCKNIRRPVVGVPFRRHYTLNYPFLICDSLLFRYPLLDTSSQEW